MTEITAGVREFLLALADDKHLMGQQHAEWIGIAPFLEEDLAFCSIGQDELGHAALVYELLSGPTDPEIDALAFDRSAAQYRSCWLVETPMTEWTDTLVRHWMFDAADGLRWELLAESSLDVLRLLVPRVAREETYHRRHADALLDSLMVGEQSASLVRAAAGRVAPLAMGLFEGVAGEADALAVGVTAAPFASRAVEFRGLAEERFGPIEWVDGPDQAQRTARSDFFAPLMARMREVFDYDPKAVW